MGAARAAWRTELTKGCAGEGAVLMGGALIRGLPRFCGGGGGGFADGILHRENGPAE